MSDKKAQWVEYHLHDSGDVVQGPALRCIDPNAGARDVLVIDRDAIQAALYKVDSTHHFHGDACLCGFTSARSRSRTEHITTAVAELLIPPGGGDRG